MILTKHMALRRIADLYRIARYCSVAGQHQLSRALQKQAKHLKRKWLKK